MDEEIPREIWLAAIDDRVERAKEHLDAIKRELIAYYESEPGSVRGEFDPEAPEGEWHLKIEPIPPRMHALIGEFLHDLRSALNHLARQLVLQNRNEPVEGSQFPVFVRTPRSKKNGKERLPDVPGHVSDEARRIIDAAQPYKWDERYREHPVWVLDKLWNIDKHRDILARGGYITAHFRGCRQRFSYTSRFESATEHAARLTLVPDDPSVEVDAHATLQVTLSEPELSQDIALLGMLEQILEAAEQVVVAAKERCF